MTPELVNILDHLANSRAVSISEANEPAVLIGCGGLDYGVQGIILRLLRGTPPVSSRRTAEYLWSIQERCTPWCMAGLAARIHELTQPLLNPHAEWTPREVWTHVIHEGNLPSTDVHNLRLTSFSMASHVGAGASAPSVQNMFAQHSEAENEARIQLRLQENESLPRAYGDHQSIDELLETAALEPHEQPAHYLNALVRELLGEMRTPFAQLCLAQSFGAIATSEDDDSWRTPLIRIFPWNRITFLDPAHYPNFINAVMLRGTSAEQLLALCRRCSNLETIDLSDANLLDDRLLLQILDACPRLSRICVSGTAVTPNGMVTARQFRSGLEFCLDSAGLLQTTREELDTGLEQLRQVIEENESTDDWWYADDNMYN